MTFGEWLRDVHTDPKLPLEIDFREDALGLSDAISPSQQELFEKDFSDPRTLLKHISRCCDDHGFYSPHPGALEGAMRCWVKWREYVWREQERELKAERVKQ